MIEQRKFARQKTFHGARISAARFAGWSLDCTVKNLGRGGARIVLPARSTIPDTFTLDIPSKVDEAARLVWHRDGIIGVSFDRHQGVAAVAPRPGASEGTRLERRISAILGRATTNVVSFERRAH